MRLLRKAPVRAQIAGGVSEGVGMPRRWRWLGVLAALGPACAVTPALADLSACASAEVAKDPHQQIDLYTICLKHGGLGATDLAAALNNRGVIYEQIGETDKAVQDFTWAIQYYPNWSTPYANRAWIYVGRGQWTLAEADATQALRYPSYYIPRAGDFVLRGEVRVHLGRYREAMADFDQALRRDRKSVSAYEDEAWLLATCPDPAIRNGAKAVQLAQAALKLADKASLHDTLAAAYAEAGQFDEAVREQSRAIELAKTEAQDGAAAAWSARLDLYRAHMPFHEPPTGPTAAS